jgi:ribosome recycling factor
MEQRKETLKQLQEHIEQYRIDNIRDEVRDQIEETKENTQYLASRNFK